MSGKLLGFAVLSLFIGAGPAWPQNQLPDGNGKEIVQSACVICHSLDRVFNVNFGPKDWDNIVDGMVNNGAPVPKSPLLLRHK